MPEEIKAFFAKVSEDPLLQQQLYVTKELCDVAGIANNLGFNVSAREILRAQADRVLSLPLEQQEILVQGGNPQSGAQWGRDGGQGYLDSAGYWLVTFIRWGYTQSSFEQLTPLLTKIKEDKKLQAELLLVKSYNEVARVIAVPAVMLLVHQAEQILKLTDSEAEKVAAGRIAHS